MNQYERIVSYIYQYRQDEKGANVGYVRLEKRGNTCRLFVQMRAVPMSSMPKVYLYRQLEQGISKIYAGQMAVRGGSMLFKADSSAEKLFGSEQGIEEMDGIFIDTEEELYFASSWKNDSFYLGAKKDGKNSSESIQKTAEQEGEQAENLQEASMENETERQSAAVQQNDVIQEDAVFQKKEEENESKVIPETVNSEAVETKQQVTERVQQHNTLMKDTIDDAMMEKADRSETRGSQRERGQTGGNQGEKSEETDIQMQSICGVCPFKRKTYDYGKKILMTFPSMKPFQPGVTKACVRMELQDIGCLPIASWSLSGNRFLLHGYYCYRHLLFAQMEDGRYVLGVPGIYSDRERKNALRFGFSDFQSIGDFGMQQGAFGYWLLELPEENQRFSFK